MVRIHFVIRPILAHESQCTISLTPPPAIAVGPPSVVGVNSITLVFSNTLVLINLICVIFTLCSIECYLSLLLWIICWKYKYRPYIVVDRVFFSCSSFSIHMFTVCTRMHICMVHFACLWQSGTGITGAKPSKILAFPLISSKGEVVS